MNKISLLQEARRAAMDLLTRREHCRYELSLKLKKKYSELSNQVLTNVLDRLEQDNLLSDERFVESFVRSKVLKGYGPMWIKNILQQKSLDETLVEQYLQKCEYDWFEMACKAREKRFTELPGNDLKAKSKQCRFLQYRGFTAEQIAYTFEQNSYQDSD